MTSPMGPPGSMPPPHGSTPPPGDFGAPPAPGAVPPPQYGAAPPPGYQAFAPLSNNRQDYAGFGERLGAFILDTLLYGLLGILLALPGLLLLRSAFIECVSFSDQLVCPPGQPDGGTLGGGALLTALPIIVVVVIYVRQLGNTGQTWGRKIAGVRVVDTMTGTPIGFGRALGRQLFARFISGTVLYLGFLWMLWDNKNQTWHDMVVDSIVVKA